MKKIILVTALVGSSLFFSSINAQPSLDLGNVKLSIQPLNGAKSSFAPGDYFFSIDNGSAPSMQEVEDGDYTDFGFGGDFKRSGKTAGILCSIRIVHPGTGTFDLKKGNGTENTITINIDNKVLLLGIDGNIKVTHYPDKPGGFLTGIFNATLNDSNIPDEIKNLYRITGSFKIKRVE